MGFHGVVGICFPARQDGFHDCRMFVLHVADMQRRPLEAEAARYRHADRKMRLEPFPHDGVELVAGRHGDGVMQPLILLGAQFSDFQTMFECRKRRRDADLVTDLPVARRKCCGFGLQACPEFEKRCTSASEPTGTSFRTEESGRCRTYEPEPLRETIN